jgi:hypothetical protein
VDLWLSSYFEIWNLLYNQLKPNLTFGEERRPISLRATSNLIAVSIGVFVTAVFLYAVLLMPLVEIPFKAQIQTLIPYLFLLSLAVFVMGGAVEVLRMKL